MTTNIGTARLVDINDHQESTERHRQRDLLPDHRNFLTTETSHSLLDKARETWERKTDKFLNLLLLFIIIIIIIIIICLL